ncbi:MAG: hypothetical protein LBH43_10510 [Treponema sp.]|jgi:hypothetical protein|nr:hypothetical protein [Treponema sp.]
MKRVGLFGITALAVLLCVLTGCPEEKIPESMTFVDDLKNPAKQFTIDEDLNFNVKFIIPSAAEKAMTIEAGDEVSGKITETDTAWNSNLTGLASQMSSTNDMINGAVAVLPITISLTYTKAEGEITAVIVAFPGEDAIVQQAQKIMGATYLRSNQ